MSATYEPGTVAVATVRGVPNVRVMRSGKGWQSDEQWLSDRSVTDVRPLVVLDLECPEGLLATLRDSLSHMLKGGPNHGRLTGLIAEIEAQTRPPKPAEPTGWLAAVEDAEGNRWALTGGPTEPGFEWYSPDLNVRRPYAAVTAVRVLSEGVTA